MSTSGLRTTTSWSGTLEPGDYQLIFRSRTFWIIAGGFLLCNLIYPLQSTQMTLLLMEKGASIDTAAWMISLFAGGVLGAALFAGVVGLSVVLFLALPRVDWTVKTLPPRHFKWRTRGNALWWGVEEREQLDQPWDVVVATSAVDLGSLIGLVPRLGGARRIVYFHENQFAYPARDGFDANLGIRDVYTALSADVLLFNSRFNRDTFLAGVEMMASKMPDHWPRSVASQLTERACVLEVGLADAWFEPRAAAPTGPLQIVWNHRWEYDKAPRRFFDALRLLARAEVEFRVHVIGQQFREAPPCFAEGRADLEDRIATWGYVESAAAYRSLLRSCDVVVSTALHEFQGLAVLEAASAGCALVLSDIPTFRELWDGATHREERYAALDLAGRYPRWRGVARR